MELILASNNKHKLEEIRAILGNEYKIVSLNDLGCHEEIPETQDTLKGNALQKGSFIYERYHKNCFADDTGLEIEFLGNQPGVYSARYAGEHCSFEDNMNKVLAEMGDTNHRKACFKTVIALILDGKEYFFEGRVDGEILRERHGREGFGYDPIFQPIGYQKSFAELSAEEKNRISHRGRAIQQLANFIKNLK